MCGIVGQLAFGELNEKDEKLRQESMIFLGSELLQMTQERGKDATGVSLLFNDGNYMGLKMGIPSVEFLGRFEKNEKEYGGFLKVWRKNLARAFIGHCRKGTGGDPLDNNNNHPIKVGDVVGVHNGAISNDDEIIEKLKCGRDGTVDSEAIFRLLHHYTKNGVEPFTTDMIQEVVNRLGGQFAVLAFSGNNPYQVVAFRDGRPMELALIKPLKLVIIASEKKFIDTAIFRYNKYTNLYHMNSDFPTLISNDIEHKMLPDDSVAIFDLRTKMKKGIELGDLYDWEKMSRVNKTWGSSITSTGFYARNQGAKKTGNTAGSTANAAKASNSGAKTTNEIITGCRNKNAVKKGKTPGRVWDEADKKFVAAKGDRDGIETSKKIKSVHVDVDTGKISDVSNGPKLKDTTADNIDNATNVTMEPAEIKELDVKTKETAKMTTVEVDASVDAEALEKAEKAAKSENKYSDAEEVVHDLEIQDEETLKSLPITALTNRIKKFIFKRGFYRGYVVRKEERIHAELNGKILQAKKDASERNVKALKLFVKMLLNIIRFSGNDQAAVEKGVVRAFEKKEVVSAGDFDKLFKGGDIRNTPLLGEIRRKVVEKENR